MEMLTNAVNWVEIPATDFARAKAFYSQIFDFEMPEMEMGPNQMGILLHDQQQNGIGGAIVMGEGYQPSQTGPLVYLNGGNDLNIVLERVEQAGGKVLLQKISLGPELGCIAMFIDSEGNRLGLHSKN